MDKKIETKIDSTIEAICEYTEGYIEAPAFTAEIPAVAQLVSSIADLVKARAVLNAGNYLSKD